MKNRALAVLALAFTAGACNDRKAPPPSAADECVTKTIQSEMNIAARNGRPFEMDSEFFAILKSSCEDITGTQLVIWKDTKSVKGLKP